MSAPLPPPFSQIACSRHYVYGLDLNGRVWFRVDGPSPSATWTLDRYPMNDWSVKALAYEDGLNRG